MSQARAGGIGAVVAVMLGLAGCGQSPQRSEVPSASATCPAGHTLVCEVDKIGRITHGTFRKHIDRCSCVPEGHRSLESPVIPSTRPK